MPRLPPPKVASPIRRQEMLEADTGAHTGPAITLGKLTNGLHSHTAPGPILPVGTPITWEYFVQNTGDVRLTSVGVTDFPDPGLVCPKNVLEPAETMVCTAAGTALCGQYRNYATAAGYSPASERVSAEDIGYYYGDPGAAVTIVTRVEGQDANTPPGPTMQLGATVHLTYEVTNTGKAPLTGITVLDDTGMAVHCPGTTLAAGQSMVCTGTETATVGLHAHTGTVQAASCAAALSARDLAYHTTPAASNPSIRLAKLVNGDDANTAPGPGFPVGTALLWTYVVTNTGDVTLTTVQVTDNRGLAVTCPKTALAPTESMTCTASGTAVSGPYSNLGTATGQPPTGPTVSATDPCYYHGIPPTGTQGCTPGYWKNHTDSWPPTGYSPSQLVRSVFTQVDNYPALASATLLDALHFQGGPDLSGAAEILLRAAVAALLNSAHPGVGYPRTTAQVILDVETALNQGNRDGMITLAAALDADNNLGCPLN